MRELPVETVQDYPRPPRLEQVPQRLLVRLGGAVVADTTRGLRVLETHHAPTYYIPREDVAARLTPVAGGSFCEWKGRARYFDVTSGGTSARRAAWSYDAPSPAFADIAGTLAFYAGRMEACFVGDARVIPQPGDFYGGWVTSNLRGRIKGAPGTEGW
ncbi:DUF427 domain-containing protein [Salipiger sp. IMCC34102]|uniref:DUF427 domain-containing protein n=1 Tax=Salipiger sp. IMCC34102 TaxID=2510647 RepID=UPI00101CAC51|nr:DUF427 domain-containing protein [Salipiger sp. IMCC34102]RYH02735.1 DUF427 domain-containing protein [Salipiger sp. IMCC34102]